MWLLPCSDRAVPGPAAAAPARQAIGHRAGTFGHAPGRIREGASCEASAVSHPDPQPHVADLHVADLQKEPHEVAAMFDGVAERYDLTNDVLSLGQTRLWRRAVAAAVDARPGERVLDLPAGTGSSSLPFV